MHVDTPPNSLIDLTTRPKVKNNERIFSWVRSLVRNTLGVKGRVGAPGWGLKQATNRSNIFTNLHKPNNKLVSA
jgi:hypothetical protein